MLFELEPFGTTERTRRFKLETSDLSLSEFKGYGSRNKSEKISGSLIVAECIVTYLKRTTDLHSF